MSADQVQARPLKPSEFSAIEQRLHEFCAAHREMPADVSTLAADASSLVAEVARLTSLLEEARGLLDVFASTGCEWLETFPEHDNSKTCTNTGREQACPCCAAGRFLNRTERA